MTSGPLLEQGVVTLREEVMPGTWLLRLLSPQIAFAAQPGQFVHIQCAAPTGTDPLLRRPFSFCDVDVAAGTYDILFNVVGTGTAILAAAEAGQHFEALGPLGRPFTIPSSGNLLLVAGGLGVAPFPFVTRQALAKGVGVQWLNGAYTAHQLYPQARLAAGVRLRQATDDGSSGTVGYVTDLLHEEGTLDDVELIHACGPTPMMISLARELARMDEGAPACEMSLEAPMGCALGTCLGCVVPTTGWPAEASSIRPTGGGDGYARVCVEGAVFDWRELDWARLATLGELVHHRTPLERLPAGAALGAGA